MFTRSFYGFQLSKVNPIFEKNSDKDKGEPTVEYKENISITEIPGGESAFKSYMAMFSEALSCLDAIYSLAYTANPEDSRVKYFLKKRKNIGISVEKTEDSVSESWKDLSDLAKELLQVLPDSIKNNPAVKDFTEKKKKLDQEYEGKTDSREYSEKLKHYKTYYSSKINPIQVIQGRYRSKACQLYASAIGIFEKGASSELDFIKNKAKEKDNESIVQDFIDRVAESIGLLFLSKKYASKAIKGFNEGYIYEDLSDGIKKIFGKSKDKPAKEKTPPIQDRRDQDVDVVYLADNIMASLISLAREIDNVITWKASLQGKETASSRSSAQEAEESASEMIDFLKDAVPYVNNVEAELKKDDPPISKIKEKLNDILKKIEIITRRDGELSKWKSQVLGAKREKTVSASYLDLGRNKKAEAEKVLADLSKEEKLQAKIEKFEPQNIIKSAIKAYKGIKDTDELPSRLRRKNYKTFSTNPIGEEKNIVKEFQNKMLELGYISPGFKEGELDDHTKKAMRITRNRLARITGKSYDDSEESHAEFQRDLSYMADNLEEIKKML